MFELVRQWQYRMAGPGRLPVLLLLLINLLSCFAGAARADEESAWRELKRLQAEIKQLDRESRHREAIVLARQALRIFEQNFDSTHPAIAVSLNDLALQYKRTKEYDQAELLYEKALAISERASELGPQHPLTEAIRDNLIELYRSRYADAGEKIEQLYLRTLAITENVRGRNDPQTATSLERLGLLYMLQKYDYAKAKPLLERSLQIRSESEELGPGHSDTVRALNNVGMLYRAIGGYPMAERLLERALAIATEKFGGRDPRTATCLHNLGGVRLAMGDYGDAERLILQALNIRESTGELGPEHLDTALALSSLGSVFRARGAYGQAEKVYLRALAIRMTQQLPNDPDIATSLGDLGGLYSELGADAKAGQLYKEALAIHEARRGGIEHPNTSAALSNLGNLYSSTGAYAKAEPLYLRALAINQQARGPQHPDTATVLNNLASLYVSMGAFAKGEPLYIQALTIREEALGPDHPKVSASLNNLATLYARMGDYAKAEPLYVRAVRILATQGQSPAKMASVQFDLALLYAETERLPMAIFLGKQAVNMLQGLREGLANMSQDLQGSFLKSNEFPYQTLAGWLVDEGRFAEAQEVMRMLKEQEFYDLVRREASADPRKTRSPLTGFEQRHKQSGDELMARLVPLAQEFAALQSRRESGYVLTTQDHARLKELQQQIKAGRAKYLDYFMSVVKTFAGVEQQQWMARNLDKGRKMGGTLREQGSHGPVLLQYIMLPQQLKIILTTSAVQKGYTVAVSRKDLHRAIDELRKLIKDEGRPDVRAKAQNLHRWLIAPIEPDLQAAGAATLMLSLDGGLRYLPFGALHDGQRWLVQRYALTNSDEASNAQGEGMRASWQMRAFGVSERHGNFPALPNVRTELQAITGVQGVPVPAGRPPLLNAQFTAESLQDAIAQKPAVLHVASHFRFQGGSEVDSFLLLGDGGKLTLDDFKPGGLYAFTKLDLLTLSACDTAMGGGLKEDGREVEGLGAMAQNNGARAVLATLWSVADESTARLMESFYAQHRNTQLTKAKMLQQAQVELMLYRRTPQPNSASSTALSPTGDKTDEQPPQQPYAHPFFWAPFVLMGNWL